MRLALLSALLATGASGTMKKQELGRLLRETGVRVTPQRAAIAAVLAEADDHPNADDVLSRARRRDDTISMATVYRTLSILEEHGLVRKVPIADAPARYEMAPVREHDHLVDIETGELIEIRSEEIDRLRREIADQLGYEIVSQHTIIRARRKRARN